jgi:prepilin-type N-terminal cleavage/methylation domain-containing protein
MLRCFDRSPDTALRAPQGFPRRRGFTVVEVLVALIVVAIGMLGVAGASALALRASSAALRERAATTRARTRLAMLEAAGCASATDGELPLGGGLADHWTIGSAANGARMVEVRAQWDDVGRRRTLVLRGALLC